MKTIPLNRFAGAAVIWFFGGCYLLLLREADGSVPPFAHFDKVAHFALFFAQIWLCAKAFMVENRPIPYRSLVVFAVLFAAGSEVGQALFTETREGSVGDAAADMLGTAAALWLADRVAKAKGLVKARADNEV
ncbi:VanZ family protein [Neisseria montereyensis]|uniref:VanZ family protein n=1 Tax=Neisseria montereyensis TaxID=2973938 RepID=A0ABT2FBQ9_9NEIS|nr:VanZ family protein [Neisseria montereyensis]MCS4533567.1 VanZ family protein [Neisseria montereyensis]